MARNLSGSDAVFVIIAVFVGVDTTAATIDITTVNGVLRDGAREIVQAYAYTSAPDIDVRIIEDVAVLAAAEDRTIDRTIFEGHERLVHKGIAGVIGACHTQTAAKDMAMCVGWIRLTYRATINEDSCLACVFFEQLINIADSQRLRGVRGIV